MDLIPRETGPLVNAAAALLGTLLGLFFRSIPEGLKAATMKAVGLAVVAIGLSMTLPHFDPVILTASLVLGVLTGEAIHIEEGFDRLAEWLKRTVKSRDARFVDGFLLATIVWCVGPMSIMGSLDAGLRGQNGILETKAILDGVTAIFFASSLGAGVLGAVVVLFVYEGAIALGAAFLAAFLSAPLITAVTGVGGLLVVAIGTNMLGLPRIKVANFLPALGVAVLLTLLKQTFHLPV